MTDFYRKLQNELTSVRPDGEFFLAATNLFDGTESQRMIRPALPSKAHIDQALLALGIDAETLRDQRGLVLLRPVRSLPAGPIAAQGLDLELNRAADLDEQFHGSETAGAVFINNPQGVRLPSFDAKSPFGKDKVCNLELNAEIVPLERRNRQRFVHTLAATDADFLFDGGWLLPMGQEDSLFDLIGAYRRLPTGKFKLHGESTPPVTIRTLSRDNSTYVYLVNDSEWPVNAQLVLDIPPGCGLKNSADDDDCRQLPATIGRCRWSRSILLL